MRLSSATATELNAPQTPSRARLETAARELETQFAQMMLKSMRSTSMGDSLVGENTMYRDMYDQQLAKELAKGQGLGLAPMIVRQLERSTGQVQAPVAPTAPLPLPGRLPAATLPLTMPHASGGSMMRMAGGMTGGFSLAPSSHGHSMPALDALALPPAPAPAAAPSTAAGAPHAGHGTASDPCTSAPALDCSSPEAFVKSIWPHAQATARELGVSARALVAQAALETGWGRRLAGGRGGDTSNNLFGIKAGSRWKGDSVNAGTHEFVGGVRRNERADFRAYGSVHESFADYARLMRNERYSGALAAGTDPARFASALQQAGYATDPSYAAKISAIANGPTLQRALGAIESAATRQVAARPDTPANALAALAPTIPKG